MTQCEALDLILGLFIETFEGKEAMGLLHTEKRGWEWLVVGLSLGSNTLPWHKANPAKQSCKREERLSSHIVSTWPQL